MGHGHRDECSCAAQAAQNEVYALLRCQDFKSDLNLSQISYCLHFQKEVLVFFF